MFDRLLTNKMFALSVACLALAALIVLLQLPGLLSAVVVPGLSDDETPRILEASLNQHAEDTELYRKRFTGRSIFFTPAAPPPIVASKPPSEDTGPPPPPPPPPPPTIPDKYGGPDILALLGDQVHVAGPKILKLGEEDPDLGLTVLEFVPPWSVKVQWHKKPGNFAPGTYVVEMFTRDYDAVFSKTDSGEKSTIEGLTQADDGSAAVLEQAGGGGRNPVEERRGSNRGDRPQN